MSCDHVNVVVPAAKIDHIVDFLQASLAHLGFEQKIRPIPTVVGMGESRPWFWLTGIESDPAEDATFTKITRSVHIAFSAQNAEQVRQFHAAALKAGGTCNGPPGPRPEYHPGYYGAFVRDPACEINWEVVTHAGGDGK